MKKHLKNPAMNLTCESGQAVPIGTRFDNSKAGFLFYELFKRFKKS